MTIDGRLRWEDEKWRTQARELAWCEVDRGLVSTYQLRLGECR